MSFASLEDALASGRGVERPFCCPSHEDSNASASVNVVKGLWVCFACGARGSVDGKRAPSPTDLASMLGSEEGARFHAERWLELFSVGDWADMYWASRFTEVAGRWAGLGQCPFTADATFPVHDHRGRLQGVGRRKRDPGDGPRYVYPKSWSSSRTLFGLHRNHVDKALVLVEGAADTTAMLEAGIRAYGCYGAGVHAPQRELIARMNPKVIVFGFDNDEAGRKAEARARHDLADIATLTSIRWLSDPADTPTEGRIEMLAKVLADCGYRSRERSIQCWKKNCDQMA